jgi:hypothetical protein
VSDYKKWVNNLLPYTLLCFLDQFSDSNKQKFQLVNDDAALEINLKQTVLWVQRIRLLNVKRIVQTWLHVTKLGWSWTKFECSSKTVIRQPMTSLADGFRSAQREPPRARPNLTVAHLLPHFSFGCLTTWPAICLLRYRLYCTTSV